MAEEPTGAVAPRRRERRPDQLAGGPHGMSREEVEANQSRRILAAMTELVAEQGYERTTVEPVITRAGVSRKTFYELRGGREQWFLAICNMAADRLLARLEAATREPGYPDDRTGRAAAALVGFCIEDPAGARICFVETLAASEGARAWRDALLDHVAATLAFGMAGDGNGAAAADGRRAELAARAAVGAVLELAGRRPEQLDRDYATALVATMLGTDGRGGADG
ncbi:MAG TPA: TetR/AcrR family transcriptional regulator [Thermoleophilaceae bacterium]|nr:TetR/AcrR family transcriptional regulator [Thermoleophilaceae bacterium]